MNRKNREELNEAMVLMFRAKEIIESISEGEQGKFDNLSEGLQQTEKGEKFELSVEDLDSSIESLDEAIEFVETVCNN